MKSLLPALLILASLILIIALALFISLRHRSRALSSQAQHNTTTPEAGHQHQRDPNDPSSPSRLLGEKYACPPPGTTYKLQPHPSIKRKRALPLVAARSPYALPTVSVTPAVPAGTPAAAVVSVRRGREVGEATSPTHSGADWVRMGQEAGRLQQQREREQQRIGVGVGDANFEEIHLGRGVGRVGSGVAGGEKKEEDEGWESVWGKNARRVAERQGVLGEKGEGDGVIVRLEEHGRAEERALGAFDFEREEAGRKKGKDGGFKTWRMSLFERGEYAG